MGSFHRPPQLNDGTFRERKQEEGAREGEKEEGRREDKTIHISHRKEVISFASMTACMPEKGGGGGGGHDM